MSIHDEFCMKTRNFVSNTKNCVSKARNVVFEMMDFADGAWEEFQPPDEHIVYETPRQHRAELREEQAGE